MAEPDMGQTLYEIRQRGHASSAKIFLGQCQYGQALIQGILADSRTRNNNFFHYCIVFIGLLRWQACNRK